MAIKDTIQALKGDGNGQVSGPKKQNQNFIEKGLTKFAINQAAKTAANIAKNAGKKATNNGMPENAIEQTIGGYNYDLRDQGQFAQGLTNPLNGTGAVAGIPEGPRLATVTLENPVEAEAPTAPVSNVPTQATTPKSIQGVTNTSTSTAQPTQESQTPPSLSDMGIPEIEEEPEVVEEIPNQQFGAERPGQTGQIYGRELGTDSNGGDFAFGEQTLVDPNSIEAKMYASRRNNYNALQSADSYSVAALIVSGTTPYGEQAMYDLQQWNPEKYNQIQEYVKEIRAGDTINAIASGNTTYGTSLADITEESIENDKTTFVNQNSTIRTADSVSQYLNNKMDTNQTAITAKQQMMIYKSQIADLQAEMADLPNKAKKVFKGDVPDYFYKAYISNNSQRIQSEIDKLESKYTGLADIYKTELAQAQRETEMNFKYLQFQETKNQNAFDQWYKASQLEQNSVQWSKDSSGNMFAYKIINGQVVRVSDGTAYLNYTSTVDSLVNQANIMANQGNYEGGECEQFTDNMAQKAAGVRMVGTSSGGETTAAEKAWYATQFGTFSDYIPEVGDVAVFTNNGTNGVSEKRGHTMYVTGYDPNTNTVTLVGSNKGGNHLVYRASYNLDEFYAHGGQGFWNPYKYAQWTASIQNQATSSEYSPMQPIIDAKMEGASMGQLANLGTFQEIYTELYRGVNEGQLDALLEQGAVGAFLQELAVFYNNRGNTTTSGGANKGKDTSLGGLFSLTITELGKEIENYLAQNAGQYSEEAYMGFLKVLRAVEIKLRDESGAAINDSERATNFLEYLPKPSDSKANKKEKMLMMEEYVRRLGTSAGINSKEYIKLFGNSLEDKRTNKVNQRSID